jgi:hypothetical protein
MCLRLQGIVLILHIRKCYFMICYYVYTDGVLVGKVFSLHTCIHIPTGGHSHIHQGYAYAVNKGMLYRGMVIHILLQVLYAP